MVFLLGLLAVVAVLASLLLMFVILLQEPKGGGIASALGCSGMEALGVSTGGVNGFTCWVAGIWIGACFLHAILQPVGAIVGDVTKTEPSKTGSANPGGGGTGGDGTGGEKSTEPPEEGPK